MPSPEACADEFARELLADRNSWKAVALANSATAQSHQSRWASAEALLQMALPHVEVEGDECLAHMIRQHINNWPAQAEATARLRAAIEDTDDAD